MYDEIEGRRGAWRLFFKPLGLYCGWLRSTIELAACVILPLGHLYDSSIPGVFGISVLFSLSVKLTGEKVDCSSCLGNSTTSIKLQLPNGGHIAMGLMFCY